MEIDFLSSSDLYFDTIYVQTSSIKFLGFDGYLLPFRILEIKEAS